MGLEGSDLCTVLGDPASRTVTLKEEGIQVLVLLSPSWGRFFWKVKWGRVFRK